MLKVTDEIIEAAQRLLTRNSAAGAAMNERSRKTLKGVVEGKRKLIDASWWREVHGDVDRARLDKLEVMADPARNSNEHERRVASAKLAAAKARRPPGLPRTPPPLPSLSEMLAMRKGKTRAGAPSRQPSRKTLSVSNSVAASVDKHTSDSGVRLKALNERRASIRAAKLAGLRCQSCGKPLTARRGTARYCSATCRSHAWRTRRGER